MLRKTGQVLKAAHRTMREKERRSTHPGTSCRPFKLPSLVPSPFHLNFPSSLLVRVPGAVVALPLRFGPFWLVNLHPSTILPIPTPNKRLFLQRTDLEP